MSSEPVVSLVGGLIVAGAAVLVAFGVPVTAEQVTALSTFAAAALGVAFYVRAKVTPTKKGDTVKDKLKSAGGQVEPLTLLIYVLIIIVILVVLLKVADRV